VAVGQVPYDAVLACVTLVTIAIVETRRAAYRPREKVKREVLRALQHSTCFVLVSAALIAYDALTQITHNGAFFRLR
jgi:hypothetical protein